MFKSIKFMDLNTFAYFLSTKCKKRHICSDITWSHLLFVQSHDILKAPGDGVIYFPTFAIRDFGRLPCHYVRPHQISVEDRRHGAENPPVHGIGKAKTLSPGLYVFMD